MQTTSKIFVSFLFCFILFLVSGCGSSQHPSALVGKWKGDYEHQSFELFKDGTAIWGGGCKWKVENNRLYIIGTGNTASGNYTVTGSTLEFNNNIMGCKTFTKQY